MNYTCPLCKSTNTYAEGTLGNRLHLRCADCGTWFSRKHKSAKRRSQELRQARKVKHQAQLGE